MRFKRMIATVLSSVMLMTAVAVPASAASRTQYNMVARINGGRTVSDASARKDSGGGMWYGANRSNTGGWSDKGNEWVYFRGRNASGSYGATDVIRRNYTGSRCTGVMSYLTGYGFIGNYYRIAIEYDNDNPYEYVELNVEWIP